MSAGPSVDSLRFGQDDVGSASEAPLDFSWRPDQLSFKAEIIAFAQRELNDSLVENDRSSHFVSEKWQRCADFGVLGWAMPEEFGGANKDPLTASLGMEALGYGCRDNGLLFALNAQMWTLQLAILHFGDEAQKQKYLPSLVSGTLRGAYAITEPETGSDAYAMHARATRCEGGYVLNGEKALVTLAPVADVALVFASTNPEVKNWGLSAFLIDRDAPGAEFGPPLEKMGLRTVPIGEIRLSDCRIPEAARLGKEGAGMAISNSSLEWERACMLSTHIGVMERQLEDTVERARSRKQFGQSIGKFQAVSHRIADMKLRLECARLLTYQVAWRKSEGHSAPLEAALAKICLSEGFVESSLASVLVHGGHGFLTDTEVERDLRDSVGSVLYGGTSDIQRNVVARLLGL